MAGTASLALVLTGCAAGGSGDGGTDEPITLTITTFGTFGYDDLYAQYEDENPNITIEATNIDTGGNARTDAFTKLAAGSGLSDIVAIEEGWLGAIMEVSDQFEDLRDYGIEDRKADWVDWKYAQGTDADGRVIGYGTDIGPEGVCYNGARLRGRRPADRPRRGRRPSSTATGSTSSRSARRTPTRPARRGSTTPGSSGTPWSTSSTRATTPRTASSTSRTTPSCRTASTCSPTLSPAASPPLRRPWDWNGGKSFVDGTFATFVCPGWMLGVVKGNVEAGGGDASTGWDFADVFPGGAANWGGAFLSVPTTSEHKEAAAALADWLTQPDQQVAQFEAAGTFPSTVPAQEQLAADAAPNEFFKGAPVGAILAGRAQGVVAQFKGPDDSLIQENVFGPPLQALDRGEADGAAAWQQAIDLLHELVK